MKKFYAVEQKPTESLITYCSTSRRIIYTSGTSEGIVDNIGGRYTEICVLSRDKTNVKAMREFKIRNHSGLRQI